MSLAKNYSAQLSGLQSEIISIEVDISNGLHNFSIVGLGDRSVDEARDRVSAAIKNSGFTSPKQKNQKVVVSMAPAEIRKEGSSFDLAIAIAYLSAAGEIEFEPDRKLFLGELSLEGRVRRVSGLLPILCQIKDQGFTQVFIPKDNEAEASLAQGLLIYPVSTLNEAINHLHGLCRVEPIKPINLTNISACNISSDFKIIRGNNSAKRGLEIAAAGAHNVILYGPPGTGKTMLAQSFNSILPALSYEQAVEVTGIHSAARTLLEGLILYPPFRAPHHTASYPSIVGGGAFPRPGEITLAHRGVLFMDEFPEFDREVLEALRQPLEDRMITISRAKGRVTFPAQCILIASMNPCPCGKEKGKGCNCTTHTLESYRKKVSGPIMDRLDIWAQVNKVDYAEMAAKHSSAESSAAIRERVVRARAIQRQRFDRYGIKKVFNGEMCAQDIEICNVMTDEARSYLTASAEKLGLSGRAFHRVIKVAQTIADLAANSLDESQIKKDHILEALQYRQKMD
jgi:magnesium chelatase family protein